MINVREVRQLMNVDKHMKDFVQKTLKEIEACILQAVKRGKTSCIFRAGGHICS